LAEAALRAAFLFAYTALLTTHFALGRLSFHHDVNAL
jgi:hypothetical protein